MSDQKIFVLVILFTLFVSGSANDPPRFVLSENEILLQLQEGKETPVGSLIYTLKGEDPDGDPLKFGVRGQMGNDLLRIESVNDTTAEVYLQRELDRETQDNYQLILTLSDGQPGNTIEQSMYILVEDINDNQPIFKPYNATYHIKEGSSPGIIAILEATDLDEGIYGQVVYSLQETDGNSGNFKVDTVNGAGVLSLVRELDFEGKYLYQLQVLATDLSNVPGGRHTGTAAIVIKVEDIEDQPPEFIKVPAVTKIPEDLSVESRILQVWAVDGDRGVNNDIHYSIVEGDNDLFGIERETGWVFVKNRLDREASGTNGAYILKIRAQEVGSKVKPVPKADTEVTIILTDVNDETPWFRSSFYVGEITENTQLNVPVTFLGDSRPEVYDYDQGKNGTFVLSLVGDNGTFAITPFEVINEATFLIRVKNHTLLDYEQRQHLEFQIIAREIVDVEPKSSSANVTVYIRDANDNIPEFEADNYIAHIREDADAGTFVVKITATDLDSGDFGNNGIRYTEIRGQIAHKLLLDPISGEITVKSGGDEFDREQFSMYFLTVEARDNDGRGNRNTVQLQLIIDDVNDNVPQFMQSRYEMKIEENMEKFPFPFLIEAFDKDLEGTPNQRIHFSIVDGDPMGNFTINKETGEIVPRNPLDYESMNGTEELRHFNLTIRAQDSGDPPLATNVSVVVYVKDANDHTPVFSERSYNATVREDIRPGDPIIQVHARDGDGSITNSRVVYRILSGAQDKFIIDADSGIISVAQGANLDPDLTDPKTLFHILEIAAIDGGIGSEQKQTIVQLNITVMDVNNKSPEFRDPGIILLKENSPVGMVVTRLHAVDRDDNPDLRFALDLSKCEARNEDGAIVRLMPNDYNSMYEVTSEGVVKIKGPIDREYIETVKLKVTVEDRNAVGLRQTVSGTVTIKIEDVNDNDPVFQKSLYKKAVPENSKPGTPIVTVVAEDRDINRTLTYALSGAENLLDLISLDPVTGEIVVRNKVDRERHSSLNFTVMATDSGIPPRFGFTNVSIQILDENDNNPIFTKDSYIFTVTENSKIGTEIGKIEATDADIGEYGKITYILDKKSADGKFAIDSDTGILTVADNLDREARDRYTLVIEAWDNYELGFATGESRKAFKQISVTILDENDMIPVMFEMEQCVYVTEYHNVGETIVLVKAEDGDDPSTSNAHIDFAINSGNQKELFSIERVDYTTARLVADKSLKQQVGNHSLSIKLTDRGQPSPLSSIGELSICITDFNDHAPRFMKPLQNHTIRISENMEVGSEVVQVEAVDDDMGANGEVRYKILNDQRGDGKTFNIDSMTGIITLRQPLDRERQKKYEIRVEAYDLGVPTPLASDIDLHFYVKNIVDIEPQFRISEVEIIFAENVEPHSDKQYLPETVDTEEYEADADRATVCYFIVGGNDANLFEVHPVRHEVTLRSPLDREETKTHEFFVKATKDCQSQPPRMKVRNQRDRTILRVVVKVLDVNDNSPRFKKDLFTGGMNTETPYGATVLTVQAFDADIGVNSQISYFILGNIRSSLTGGVASFKAPPFEMNRTTGEVTLNFYPQKTMKGYFHFRIRATDTGGLNDTSQVMIYLVRQDQKVTFTLRLAPDELQPKIDHFQRTLSNITGTIVNIDMSKYHENNDGSVDRTKTDVLMHFVLKEDNSIINVKDVVNLIDDKIEDLNTLFRDFNVLECKPTIPYFTESGHEEILVASLIGSTACLGLFLILSISICIVQRNRYERQLKAATAVAFGSEASTLNRTNVPNTNQHSIEGSNPIWMHSYENEWYKEHDSISVASRTSDSDNSLDENVVNSTEETSMTHVDINTYSKGNGGGGGGKNTRVDGSSSSSSQSNASSSSSSSCVRKNNEDLICSSAKCIQQQNDLNRLQRHSDNIYDSLGLLNSNGSLLTHHLETTEL